MNQRLNDFSSLRTHPYSIMMYLFLTGLTMIFVGLSFAYIYTRIQTGEPPIRMPYIFLVNTLVLFSSSWTLRRAKQMYETDNTEGYQKSLLATVLIIFLFMVLQYIGWEMLINENPLVFKTATSHNMSNYIYAISVIHVFHILFGLPFFLLFLFRAYTKLHDPVTVLVYFTDPVKQLELRLLSRYWHFLDYLWLYLMVFFWANYFIQLPK
jgi:cytochrome c oxidase subunit III